VLREKTLTATSDNVWKSYPHRADFDTHVAGPELQIGRDERSWSERAGSVHGLFDQVEALRLGCNVAQIRLPTPTTSAPIFVSAVTGVVMRYFSTAVPLSMALCLSDRQLWHSSLCRFRTNGRSRLAAAALSPCIEGTIFSPAKRLLLSRINTTQTAASADRH